MNAVLRKIFLLFLLTLIAVVGPLAQAPGTVFDGQTVIPFDSAIRTGTLSNGLRYYIRENDRPANRVALRLAVKAGSLERLRAFYDTWYRPQLMAVVAVGHLQTAQIESTIRATFGPLEASDAGTGSGRF